MPVEFTNPAYIDPGLAGDVSAFLATAAADATAKVAAEAAARTAALAGFSGPSTIAWSAVTGKPAAFAPAAHTHAQADVTNLTADIAAKSATGHTHGQADVTGLTVALSDLAASIAAAGGTPLLRSVAQGPPINAAIASLALTFAGDENDLLVTATNPGAAGNGVTLQLVGGAGTNPTLVVSVIGTTITVILRKTDGVIQTLAHQLRTAINNHPEASLLVLVTPSGSDSYGAGNGEVAALGATSLAGGVDGTTAAYIFQPCIVGDPGGPYDVFVSTRLSPTRWFKVPNSDDVLTL